MVRTLAHWWNGRWGGMTRRDVWVDLLDDGRYQVRWRGGAWRDRDGLWCGPNKHAAWATVRKLLADGGEWKKM